MCIEHIYALALPVLVLHQEEGQGHPLPVRCTKFETVLCPLVLQLEVLFCRKAAKHNPYRRTSQHQLQSSGRGPSVAEAWLGSVKQISLDWFLTKIHQTVNTRFTQDTREATKDQHGPPRPGYPRLLPWGSQTSMRTQFDLMQQVLFSLIKSEVSSARLQFKWTPHTMSWSRSSTHEPFVAGMGREGEGIASLPHRFPAAVVALRCQPWYRLCAAFMANRWIGKTPLKNEALSKG